jgi:hypothetical protein
VVEGKKSKTVNSKKWKPLVSSSLTVAGRAIPQWTEYYPSYSSDSDENKENDKRTARWSTQQSSNEQSAVNGNNTEETQHGPTPIPPNIGLTNDTGNKCNKRIRWSEEEMRKPVWCFMYMKATTLTENYKAAYKLWREREIQI